MRAPLLPIGSLATWTTISCPSVSSVSILAGWRLLPLGLVEVVAHVEEGGLLEADVHEGRLHARQHTGHAAQRHHARHAAVALAFDVKLRELAQLHDRHAGLPGAGIDQDLVLRSGLPGAGIRRHASRLRRWRAVSVNDRGWRTRKARAWRG